MLVEIKLTMQSTITFVRGEVVKIPIENAVDIDGNPVTAYYEKRGFDTYSVTMGEKTLPLKELNALWFHFPGHFAPYFGIRTLGENRYLCLDWDSYTIEQVTSRINTVQKFIMDVFGVDIEKVSVE